MDAEGAFRPNTARTRGSLGADQDGCAIPRSDMHATATYRTTMGDVVSDLTTTEASSHVFSRICPVAETDSDSACIGSETIIGSTSFAARSFPCSYQRPPSTVVTSGTTAWVIRTQHVTNHT